MTPTQQHLPGIAPGDDEQALRRAYARYRRQALPGLPRAKHSFDQMLAVPVLRRALERMADIEARAATRRCGRRS